MSAHAQTPADLPEAVQRVMPSAVYLRNLRPERDASRTSTLSPTFDELLRASGANEPRPSPKPGEPHTGKPVLDHASSGFIVSADGYIAIGSYVGDDVGTIEVELFDHRVFTAARVGADRSRGVALLKIDASGLTPVHFGDALALRQGERVFAIGAPYEMQRTVTDGIVSALDVNPLNDPGPLIQTTVPVNPGNGGGPLANMRGEVVGMVTSIYTRTGSFSGLSFAVRGDTVQRVYDELRRTGHVARGMIGVRPDAPPMPPQGMARRGALLTEVMAGGAAARAGLRAQDILVRFGNVVVESASHLVVLSRDARPGETVPVEVLRDGRSMTLPVVIDAAGVAPQH